MSLFELDSWHVVSSSSTSCEFSSLLLSSRIGKMECKTLLFRRVTDVNCNPNRTSGGSEVILHQKKKNIWVVTETKTPKNRSAWHYNNQNDEIQKNPTSVCVVNVVSFLQDSLLNCFDLPCLEFYAKLTAFEIMKATADQVIIDHSDYKIFSIHFVLS